MLAFGAVAWLVGLVLIPAMSLAEAWVDRPSRFPRWGTIRAWKGGWVTWLWGNEEDGVTGAKWYRDLHSDWSDRKRAIFWSTFRNPSNNMRFIPLINPTLRPERIRFKAWTGRRLASDYTWIGVHAGFRAFIKIAGKTYRFWIGWKLKPEDRFGLEAWDYRSSGCGFCLQFKQSED